MNLGCEAAIYSSTVYHINMFVQLSSECVFNFNFN